MRSTSKASECVMKWQFAERQAQDAISARDGCVPFALAGVVLDACVH
jgi:hypothetical protein